MKIAIVGTGYVGLVTGTCFAEVGNEVTCVDVDERKIDGLRNNILPIYEPGLEELVERNQEAGRLNFSTDLGTAMADAEVVFVGVGTPQRDDGSADLKYVWSVIDEIKRVATSPKVVVVKSTVPVGTNEKVLERLNDGSDFEHSAASNPEFLREGLAISDCLNPDRIVVGVRDDRSKSVLGELYSTFTEKNVPLLFMKPESAEMTKYVANCVLATKISYINEMANMCEAVDADINDVRQGIGYDQRIGFQFFAPGVGYGGSCFPKDVRAMKSMARSKKMPMRILEAVDFVNEEQKHVAFKKLVDLLSDLNNATIAVWGLAFKPQTDDIREAPSLVLLRQLIDTGATIQTYDPEAADNVREVVGDAVEFCSDKEAALRDADVLVIMTEWSEFRDVTPLAIKESLRGNVVVDGRNLFDPAAMAEVGLVYSSIGRATVGPNVSNTECAQTVSVSS